MAGGGASGRGSISPQYKTVLCNQTDCKFGSESCNFAHTVAELRTVQQNLAEINPNYKGKVDIIKMNQNVLVLVVIFIM